MARSTTAWATARSCRPTPVPSNRVISSSEVRPGWVPLMTAPISAMSACVIRPCGDGVLGLADGDRLRDLVGEHGGLREQGGLDLLLALGVGAHAGDMGAGADLVGLEDRRRSDEVMVMITSASRAEPVELDRLEGQAELGRDRLEARQHLGVEVPADDLLEVALFEAAARSWNAAWWPAPTMPSTLASLRARCLIDTDEAAAVRRAVRRLPPTMRLHAPGVGIEQEHRGLVVGQALRVVARPVAAGLQAQRQAGPVEPGLEAVERVGMADRLADDREVVGIAPRHGGEDLLDGVEAGFGGDQVGDGAFGDDEHGRGLSGSRRGGGPGRGPDRMSEIGRGPGTGPGPSCDQ